MLYGMAAVICLVYVIAIFLSGKERTEEGISFVLRPFYRMGMCFYKIACIRKLPLFQQKRIQTTLALLHPGEVPEHLYRDYCVGKLAKSFALVLAGTLLSTLVCWKEEQKTAVLDGMVKRGEYTEAEKELELTAGLPELEGEYFTVLVGNRVLQQEEAEALYQTFCQELPDMIKGENTSLQEVYHQLLLEEEYEGYPFIVEWKSSRQEIIGSTGEVSEQEEEVDLVLKASVQYGDNQWETDISIKVVPPIRSTKEQLYRQLGQLLEKSEEVSREAEEWVLPNSLGNQALDWQEKTEHYGEIFWCLALITAVLIYFLADQDLGSRLDLRKRQLKQEYPELLHKLVLYLGAGLTVRGAFGRVTEDYGVRKQRNKRAGPLGEELRYAWRELQAGVSEGVVYEHFGKRTELQQYIRLSTLLQQNLKKGNSALLVRLREEAEKAITEQLQQSRKLGEEATTKCLLPMVMMLGVVMVIIMVPAFLSAGF